MLLFKQRLSSCTESTLYHTIPIFTDIEKRKAFKNIVETDKNAGDQHFLLFPQCFPTL